VEARLPKPYIISRLKVTLIQKGFASKSSKMNGKRPTKISKTSLCHLNLNRDKIFSPKAEKNPDKPITEGINIRPRAKAL